MIRKIIPAALIILACSGTTASAQVAKQKGATLEQISNHVNTLIQKNTDEAKADVIKEAQALAASNDESFVNFAVRIYSYLGNNEEVEKINKSTLKKFPKGIKARQEAYNAIFNEESNEKASAIEKKYNQWLKQYPSSSFDAKNQGIYEQALSSMSFLYLMEGDEANAQKYLSQLEQVENFPIYASTLSSGLVKNNQTKIALPIAAKGYALSEAAFLSSDPKVKGSAIASRYNSLAPIYAQILSAENQYEKSADILDKFFTNNPRAKSSLESILTQTKNYQKIGRDLDAFNLLNNQLVTQGSSEIIVNAIKPIYEKLNNQKGDFSKYLEVDRKSVV